MAWNENGNGQDPWGDRKRGNKPSDLDKLFNNLQRKLRGLGGGGDGGGSGSGSDGSAAGLLVVLVIGLVFWLTTGFYRVDQAERGLELRFGEYVGDTGPGLHWHLPYPIETVEKVNASVIDRFEQEIQMLTADENFVVINLAVQYRRRSPEDFQFNVRDPIATVSDVSESAIREAVGKHPADFTLLGNRAEVAELTKQLIQSALDAYEAGIEVTAVNLQKVDFPRPVQDAVQDAVKAREDKEQAKLSAQTYENQIIPEARGEAARQLQNAEAYKQRVINDASGEAARFTALLKEYAAAPEVTRERLYIDALEEVYTNSSKVFIDADGEGNLLYLPLDKLVESSGQRSRASASGTLSRQNDVANRPSLTDTEIRDNRTRRARQ
ncbi:MAG: FtsH protease activity modulator HflK [Pseudomonadota bacterium]